jgi:hypothetical protein
VCTQCGCCYDRVLKAQVDGKLIFYARGCMMIQRALVVFFVTIITVQLYCLSEMRTRFYIVNNFVVGFVCFSRNEMVGHFMLFFCVLFFFSLLRMS